MKRITVSLVSLAGLVLLTLGASFASSNSNCCNGSPCCNGGACCRSHHNHNK